MSVSPDGSSPYQDLIAPFKTNPNVDISPLMEQLAVRFVGMPDAVFSAYKHVADALNKTLHIDDKLVLFTSLSTLYCSLHADPRLPV